MNIEIIMDIVNLVCAIVIAAIGWNISIKLSKNSKKISAINSNLIKRIGNIAEHSSILKAVPKIVLTNKTRNPEAQGENNKKTEGISLNVNGTIKLDYGRISQVYICWHNDTEDNRAVLNYDIVWNSHKDGLVKSVNLDKTLSLSKQLTSGVLTDYFYLIIVDEAKIIHRVLIEIISDIYTKANGVEQLSIDIKKMQKARMDYRTFNDDEILVYDQLRLKKPWINADSGNEETNYKKKKEEQDQWLDNYSNLSEINLENEVRKINRHFALVGLK